MLFNFLITTSLLMDTISDSTCHNKFLLDIFSKQVKYYISVPVLINKEKAQLHTSSVALVHFVNSKYDFKNDTNRISNFILQVYNNNQEIDLSSFPYESKYPESKIFYTENPFVVEAKKNKNRFLKKYLEDTGGRSKTLRLILDDEKQFPFLFSTLFELNCFVTLGDGAVYVREFMCD